MRRGLDDPVTQFCAENGLRPAIPVEPGSHNRGSVQRMLSKPIYATLVGLAFGAWYLSASVE